MTKKQIIKKLTDLKVEFDANLSAPDLKELLDGIEAEIEAVNTNIQEEVLNDVKEELEPIQEEKEVIVNLDIKEEVKEIIKVYSGITLKGSKWIAKDGTEHVSVEEAAIYQGGLN